ncbi:MAG TPA: hypothetical protein EYQ62_11875 [Verrucomicrobiales bacterium]|nr:hypothetical protein [Verrucomicrobiales bacterium]HIL24998.1 hypothetical protein [Verrucomicrobiota bacterium]
MEWLDGLGCGRDNNRDLFSSNRLEGFYDFEFSITGFLVENRVPQKLSHQQAQTARGEFIPAMAHAIAEPTTNGPQHNAVRVNGNNAVHLNRFAPALKFHEKCSTRFRHRNQQPNQ